MTTHGPAVFVHGNPETTAIWNPLLADLHREDAICLTPPGFGAPLPTGFEATMAGYQQWLVRRLEAFAEPVDLVGHDWGGLHVFNVAMTRPELIRSWVSDAVGVFDPAYEWHPLARQWQRPGDGERWMQENFAIPLADRVRGVQALGIDGRLAEQIAAGQDQDMGTAILALYRSVPQPAMVEAGRRAEAAAARPGLAISATEDTMTGSPTMRQRVADRAHARVASLAGLGHWWLAEDPARGAEILTRFWSDLE